MRTLALICLGSLAALGCNTEDFTAGESARAITGSVTPDSTAHPYVGVLDIERPPDEDDMPRDPRLCTGTMIAKTEEATPRALVLTAANCVWFNYQAENDDEVTGIGYDGIKVEFGLTLSREEGNQFGVDEIEIYRYFDEEASATEDLAILTLDGAPAADPAVLPTTPLTAADAENMVTMVGYGTTMESNEDLEGTRNRLTVPLGTLQDDHLTAGNDEGTTCAGDAGGPVFMDRGSGDELVAVTAIQSSCRFNVRRLRVDFYLDFIQGYIDRYNGDCCDLGAGCSPAASCEACDWSGTCQADCPTRDWDCPVEEGKFVGDACEVSGDCEEGGRCITATDDETFNYCSKPCDLMEMVEQCPAGMACTDDGMGGGECAYTEPSRGSQGFACIDNSQCRSGICEDEICVFECDPAQGADACKDPYTCGPSDVEPGKNVCLGTSLTGGGGFCAAGRPGSPGGQPLHGLWVLVLAGVWLRFRRRA